MIHASMSASSSTAPKSHFPLDFHIDLGWALDILQRVPGAHRNRILSKSAIHAAREDKPTPESSIMTPKNRGMSREELGRGTWTFLHTLAAQWPEQPSKQQKRDARTLIDVMTRIYPCASCASHFSTLVKKCPPAVNSQLDFQYWMCDAHNEINHRLGKPLFNRKAVALRWPSVECDEADVCALQ